MTNVDRAAVHDLALSRGSRWMRRIGFALALSALSACATTPPGGQGSTPIAAAEANASGIFTEPDVDIPTPAFTSHNRFTNQAELLAFADRLARRDHVHLIEVGRSQIGQTIPMLVFTEADSPRPESLRQSGLPTVWVHAQQHGNEPASGEGALALAADLAGPRRDLLKRVNVIVVPRANPDGSRHGKRSGENGLDINRDSMRQILAESRQLRRMNVAYAPVLTIDAHEYGPARDALKVYGESGYLEAYDMMLLGPENLNVHSDLRTMTRELLIDTAIADLRKVGLSAHEYYSVRPGTADEPPLLALGSTDARIGRNYHGLINQTSILLESRGIGLGREHFKRRTYAQWMTMLSLIQTVADNASQIKQTLAAIRQDIVQRGMTGGDNDPVAVGTEELPPVYRDHPYIDRATGQVRMVNVRYIGREQRVPRAVRQRPLAYIIDADQFSAAAALLDLGVRVYRLDAPVTLNAEIMRVTGDEEDTVPYEGVFRRFVEITLEPGLKAFPTGVFVVPMNQALANVAIEALEPEGPDSFVCFGIIARRNDRSLPVYRLMDEQAFHALPTRPMPSGMPLAHVPGVPDNPALQATGGDSAGHAGGLAAMFTPQHCPAPNRADRPLA